MGPVTESDRSTQSAGGGGPRDSVVVGVDGSQNARTAATWAAAEAARRGVSLTVAHALYLTYNAYLAIPPEPDDELWREKARVMTEHEAQRLGTLHPGLPIHTAASDGPADLFLETLSEHAALLVTGTRGHGGFAGMLVGSVSRKLAAHAHCPLVVVRTEPPADPRDEVVLGVGPKPSPAAVRFAFRAAEEYGARLTVVRAWWPTAVYGGFAAPGGMSVDHGEMFRAAAAAGAEEAVKPLHAEYPGVETQCAAAEGNTVPALLEAANGARLLVVGAHRHRGPLAVGAGYVVDGVLAHSRTPVAVVPVR
jgi:nucleotide-binding universal stress UspA family protein